MAGTRLPQRMMAKALVRLRESVKISRDTAAKHIQVGTQTLWRWETARGESLPKRVYVDALCTLYKAPSEVREALLALCDEAHDTAWWHRYTSAIPDDFDFFLGFEMAANAMWTYQASLLPGLLQTPEYRQAMIGPEAVGAPPTVSKQWIELTARRQKRLGEDGFSLHAVMPESVLHYPIGSPAIMSAQLVKIAATSELPGVSVRIVPWSVGGHAGLTSGSFVLFDFPPQRIEWMSEDPMVYIEQRASDLYLGDAAAVDQYRSLYQAIEAVALPEDESRQLVLKIAEEFVRDR